MLCFAIQLAAVGYNAVANLGILTIGGGHPVPDLGVDVPVCAEQIVTGVVISESQIVPVILQGAFIEHSHTLKAVHTHREVFVVELLQKEVPFKTVAAPGHRFLHKVNEKLPADDKDTHAGQILRTGAVVHRHVGELPLFIQSDAQV